MMPIVFSDFGEMTMARSLTYDSYDMAALSDICVPGVNQFRLGRTSWR